MDPIKINLATFKYYDKRVASIALVVIILLLGGVTMYNVTQAIQGQREILNYKGKIKRLEKSLAKSKKAREKVRKKLKGEEMRAIREGTAFVNRLIAKNAFPWDRLLDAIETSIPKGVTLQRLTVTEDYRTVKMKGVAETSDKIDLLLGRLKKSGVFKRNLLTKLSIKELGKSDPAHGARKGTRFEIESRLSIGSLFTGKEYEEYVKDLKRAF
ncbi:MAG: hypothetical protein DRN37_05240 [Thermoplasmata archaeon]|nr:MAG: hypothetical protein DRG82_11050 [Deltaproteobacteria bacterium]RLF58265.1 MAG: hypothetical protein DRN37_05240 [Thermoplasmata archaeon]